MFTTDPQNQESWKPADFSCKSHGFIDGLTRGTTYYFKARVHLSKTGKKDWTQIVDILCL
jgi:hypothetical protein